MLTIDILTYEQAIVHAASELQAGSLAYVRERFQAAEFIKRSDGAFEFGRAHEGRILGMVTATGGVTSNMGDRAC